ncbi:glycosyltransferase family 4 protein [Streptomyces sp. NPDC006610]|uniref:glycosyltransferase family 4 protein n=1 Tax=Streptomyces sp. NPDC006610 TaxID=3154584 RepID=UPI0033A9E257
MSTSPRPSGREPSPTGRLSVGVVHLAFEGIQVFYGGIGTVIRGQISTLPAVASALADHGVDLVPHFVELAYGPDHPRYDPVAAAEWSGRITAAGGTFHRVPNYTTGREARGSWGVPPLGDYHNWQVSSAAAAGVLLDLAARHDVTVAFCHETPFVLTPVYSLLQAEAAGVNLTAVYVAHSSALLHELPLPNPERLMAESLAVHWPKVCGRARVGVISDYMGAHLRAEYGARDDTLTPVGNGVDPADPWYGRRPEGRLREVLARHGVPLDRDLVVTFGRAVPYKRHDLLLRAAALLDGRVHAVAMSHPDNSALTALAERTGVPCTLPVSHDRELMASLLQWPRTRACVLSAENEPCGIIPMEARLLARDAGALLVVSDSGGFVEQVCDGVDAFVHRSGDAEHLADVLRAVLALPAKDAAEIRRRGTERVLENHLWPAQIVRSLAAVVPRIATVADTLVDGLTARARTRLSARSTTV